MPVCSEECKKIVEDATKKEIEEMTKFKSLE
jgi:predicted nucleic acid-binding Zn ribbon protein